MLLTKEKEEQLITVAELFQMELEEGYYYELLNGHIVKKQAPSPQHQEAVSNLNWFLNNFVREHDLGKVYTSPIDVFFDKYNNTQPDILFIKKERLFIVTEHGIEGHPDLIVEVLSKSTYKQDRYEKIELYRKFGVPEYWIADPEYKIIDVYSLENNAYTMDCFDIECANFGSKILTDIKIDMAKVFA